MSAIELQIFPEPIDNCIFDQIPPTEIARHLHTRADRIDEYIQHILHKLDIDSETTLKQVMAWVID